MGAESPPTCLGAWAVLHFRRGAGFRAYNTSLALDTSGNPHISYCDFTNGDEKYAYLPEPAPLSLLALGLPLLRRRRKH